MGQCGGGGGASSSPHGGGLVVLRNVPLKTWWSQETGEGSEVLHTHLPCSP